MTSPLLLSLPLPSLFPLFTPPPLLLNVSSCCLPSPLFFSALLFFHCLCQSPWSPDGGAADQNVPVPWRQSDQCGLEPRWQTLCHWRTEGTVLSMCKWMDHFSCFIFNEQYCFNVFVRVKCLQYLLTIFLSRIMYHLCVHYLYSINAEHLVCFEGTGSLQGRGGRCCIWVMVYV